MLLPTTIKTTRDLRLSLLQTYEDLVAKRITPHEARARAIAARAILDTVRTELVLARSNLSEYRTIDLTAKQEISGK
jgi:hypothetical protein